MTTKEKVSVFYIWVFKSVTFAMFEIKSLILI